MPTCRRPRDLAGPASRFDSQSDGIRITAGGLPLFCTNDFLENGAARGIRTPDPVITNDVLYRLSYCGVRAFYLTRFLDANRYPLRLKTRW
jgi:hypothetical protein